MQLASRTVVDATLPRPARPPTCTPFTPIRSSSSEKTPGSDSIVDQWSPSAILRLCGTKAGRSGWAVAAGRQRCGGRGPLRSLRLGAALLLSAHTLPGFTALRRARKLPMPLPLLNL